MAGTAVPDALRTRYYDWCSAKIAERCMRMSPEEVWKLSAAESQPDVPTAASRPADTPLRSPTDSAPDAGFGLVRKLAQRIADELDLPGLEEWAEQYLRDPEPFEREIVARGVLPSAPPAGSERLLF